MCLHLCQILQHEDYSFPSFDVALLYIDGEVDADGTTVDFATLAETDAEDFVGNDCEIAAWGQTDGEQQIIYAILLAFWLVASLSLANGFHSLINCCGLGE